MSNIGLTFLKLGGAVLTDKGTRETVRDDVLKRLAEEIVCWTGAYEGRLVLAHGGGSFAHYAVSQSGLLTRPADPLAMARVADATARLNRLVIAALLDAGLPAWSVPGAHLVECEDGAVAATRSELITAALERRLLPVIYGDVAFDVSGGGAVASTEPILVSLAAALQPKRLILATDVDGIFPTDPHAIEEGAISTAEPLARLSPRTRKALRLGAARDGVTDVSGGMATKVDAMLELVRRQPALEIRVISGLRPGAVAAALGDTSFAGGTLITTDD